MAAIKGKNTSPELTVRKLLHSLGFRFRLHDKKLPGKPDIVLNRYRTVVEVRGCFWHRHQGCRFCTNPATRKEFWQEKFASNTNRDFKNDQLLQAMGWKVVVVWECEIRDSTLLQERLLREIS